MPKASFTLEGLDELKKSIHRETGPNSVVLKHARIGLDDWAEFLRNTANEIIDREAWAEGTLAQTSDVLTKGDLGLIREIVYPALYAAYINDGTRPHGFDPKLLERWVRLKNIRLRDPEPWMTADDERKAVAFLIMRKIKREGTKGIKFMERAMAQTEGPGFEMLVKEIERGLNAI